MQVVFRLAGSPSRALVLALVVCALGPGCGGSSSGIGPPPGSGEGGSGTGGAGTGSGGSSNGAGGTGAGLGSGSGGSIGSGGVSGAVGSAGSTGFGGSFAAGGTFGAGGVTGFGGSFAAGGTFGSGGVTGLGGGTARGGSIGSGGVTGLGGSGAAGRVGAAGAPGAGGNSGAAGGIGAGGAPATGGLSGTGTGGTTSTGFCPAGAIFCADFEEASGVPTNRPVGTATFVDTEAGTTFDGVMALDATAPYDGNQSLKVTPASAVAVRALAVAVPSTFWVRLYIKSDQSIGQPAENGFFGAGTSSTFATGNYVELSEDLGCLFLNKGGTLFPSDRSCGLNAALSMNAWHCLVAAFDGGTGDVMVFSGSTEIFNAAAWAPAHEAFNTFELGTFVDNPNGATVWYDDVVISAMPLTCP